MEGLSVNYSARINKMIAKEWEEGNKGRHYFFLQPIVKNSINIGLGRKDSVVISRLRLGDCTLNYGLSLVVKHPDDRCICGEVSNLSIPVRRSERKAHFSYCCFTGISQGNKGG